MRRHRLDLISLFFGLSFVAIGGVFISGEIDVTDIEWAVTWPLPIIAGGLMMLAAALRGMGTSRREPAPEAVTDVMEAPQRDEVDAPDTEVTFSSGDEFAATATDGPVEDTEEAPESSGQERPPIA